MYRIYVSANSACITCRRTPAALAEPVVRREGRGDAAAPAAARVASAVLPVPSETHPVRGRHRVPSSLFVEPGTVRRPYSAGDTSVLDFRRLLV